jgi:predicted acetyltransferase
MSPLAEPSAEELAAFVAMGEEALRLVPGRAAPVADAVEPAARRVLRRDGAVVAGAFVLPTEQCVGGALVPCAAISFVAVAPEHRGRGAGRELMTAVLEEARAAGTALSCLHPANLSLYRRVGYEVAARRAWTRARLDALPRAGDPAATVAELADPAPEDLEALHRAWVARTPGALLRHPAMWAALLGWAPDPVRAALAYTDGELTGAAVFTRGADDALLRVQALVALDRPAALALLAHLAGHRSIFTEVQWPSAPFDPFAHLLAEEPLDARSRGVMVRVVDVAAALAGRSYPPALAARLELELADAALPANAGRWRVEIADGRAEVDRGGRGSVGLDARALAALFTGHATPAALTAVGGLRAAPPDAALLHAAFAGPSPVVNEEF